MNEKFAGWMSLEGLGDIDVAEKLDMDVSYIWRLRTGKVRASESFAWKFAKAYGFRLARKLFDSDKEPA